MTMQLPLIGKVKNPSPWLIGLVAVGLLGTGTAGVLAVRNSAKAPDISTMTVPVQAQDLTVRITASGKVQPVQSVNLSPKATGIVAELLVEQGDRVKRGQIIARMQSDDIGPRLVQAQAKVAQAQANLDKLQNGNRPAEIAQREADVSQAQGRVSDARSRLQLANDRLERNRTLQAEGAISQDALDAVANEARSAQANLDQAQANLRSVQQALSLSEEGSRSEDIASARAQLKEAVGSLQAIQVQQEDTLIRAPFDGIITQKYATEGAFVAPTTSASEATSATSTALVAIADGLEVLAEVPEVDIGRIRLGQTVEVRADAMPDQVFRGRVKVIAPEAVVKQNVTSFQVRIELVTGQDKLLSGMNTELTFVGDRLPQALAVPTVAIVTRDGKSGVLVPNAENKPEFRQVTVGTAVGDETQILEGLKVGDRVFTDLPPEAQGEWLNPGEQTEPQNQQQNQQQQN